MPRYSRHRLPLLRLPTLEQRVPCQRCVENAIDEMAQSHSRVYLVGHSMGALMSILAAVRQPERIAGMILMAVPLRLALKPSAVLRNILKGVGLGESPEELARY